MNILKPIYIILAVLCVLATISLMIAPYIGISAKLVLAVLAATVLGMLVRGVVYMRDDEIKPTT